MWYTDGESGIFEKNYSYQATYAQMTYVLHDMIDFGYKPKGGEVCVAGMINIKAYSKFENINSITGLGYDNAVTADLKSIDYYFDYILGFPINVVSNDERNEIMEKQEYQEMPVYPQEGYIKYIDDVLVIKLK